jgi:anti-sigma factor RsiW
MTDDDVRDRFSAYHDRELDPAEHEAVRAALASRPALEAEYQSFCKMIAALGAMAAPDPVSAVSPASAPAPAPDLLHGVQRKLQRRSRGKFYGDAWSRVAGIVPLELMAALLLVALVALWFALHSISVQPAPTPSAPPSAPAVR